MSVSKRSPNEITPAADAEDGEVIASFFSEHGRAAHIDRDLDRHMADLARHEGFDDVFVGECRALLSEWTSDMVPRPSTHDPAERRAAADRVLYAKLHLEAGRMDRAEVSALEALSIVPADQAARSVLAATRHRQGKLTEAIRIWRSLAEERAVEPSTLRLLGRIFEVALRAREGAAWPAPSVALAIPALADFEHAFELALSHDFRGALRLSDRVIERYRSTDLELFKLGALQRAWLLEQMGDIADAIFMLERLADEPGLAHDTERLLALSALYEREGTPPKLRRAVRAVRHAFLATHDPILLRRLARLLERLGYRRLAELFEARYREAFRRRMHDLTLRELVRAASTVHVSVAKLCDFRYPVRSIETLLARHIGRRRSVHQRRAGILYLLLGDRSSAREVYRGLQHGNHSTPTDLKYLGELEMQLGNKASARAPLLRAIELDPDLDGEIITHLIDDEPQIADDLANAIGSRMHAARRSVFEYAKARPNSAQAWSALARLDRAVGQWDAADRHAQRATLVRAGAIDRQRIGRVLSAAAFRHAGEVRGVVHELWFTSQRVRAGFGGMLEDTDVLGGVAPDLRREALNVFQAVRAFALHRFVLDEVTIASQRFTLKMTKEDEPSSGDSAGLPVAIALLSMLLRIPLPDDIAMSGALITDSHDALAVRRVGDIDAKIEGAYERRLRMLILPAENRDDVERAERVPRDVAARLVHFVDSLDDAVEVLFGDPLRF
jgi:tetratricopeptide (TPR) repeat protein